MKTETLLCLGLILSLLLHIPHYRTGNYWFPVLEFQRDGVWFVKRYTRGGSVGRRILRLPFARSAN